MAVYIIVATKCQPQAAEQFKKWYNEIHIPLMLQFKSLKTVTFCQLAAEDKNAPPYLAIQEFDSLADAEAFRKSPALAAAREELKKSWPDATAWEISWWATYEVLKRFSG